MKTIDQIDVNGKKVLMRVDFNVPLDEHGAITDDSRIVATLPTIENALDRGASVILMSHLGRPDGTGYEPAHSMKPVADRLSELLPGRTVTFPDTDCTSDATANAVDAMPAGSVVVLENLRFHKGEIANDASFAQKLSRYGEVYCNDAFGASHRDHASMVAVPRQMADVPRVAGLLLKKEVEVLSSVLRDAAQPLVVVLGGAKVSDKIGVISNLIERAHTILVGGAMSYTFLKALGHEIGSSKAQLGMLEDAREILDDAAASPADLVLPVDHVCGREITRHTPVKVFVDNIESGWMGLDIGPKTTALFAERIDDAKTIVWNGPMGVFETDPFDVGTREVAHSIAKATASGATSIVGGGDTAAAIQEFGMVDKFSHISTGGGASLEFLEGKLFASLAVLEEA